MRRRLGIWGASEESLRLLRLLSGNPDVEVLRIFDDSVASALERARGIGTALAHQIAPLLLDDEAAFFAETEFDAIIKHTVMLSFLLLFFYVLFLFDIVEKIMTA